MKEETKKKSGVKIAGGYRVDSDGTIWSAKLKRPLRHIKHSVGYLRVNVNGKMVGVHRLVAECFVDNPEGKPEVDHIDGDKSNNDASNLRWVTHKENLRYARERLGNWSNGKGNRSRVRKVGMDGVVEYASIAEACRAHGKRYNVFAAQLIRAMKNGWRCYGGVWSYVDGKDIGL